jgi:AcrR family transcriptional regulator
MEASDAIDYMLSVMNSPRRRYHSPGREEQAARTRLRILAGARLRFERDGYAATSMAAIATEAGVSLKTVYLAFETKAGLLRALWHLLLRGERDDVPVGEQAWFREVLEEPDPSRQVELNARNSLVVKRRAGRLLEVIRDAASSDPEILALWERIQTEFHANQRTVVDSLAAARALRDGLDTGTAADVLWALNHPTLYQLLARDRGWSPERYEDWLAAILTEQLLGRPAKSDD